MDEVLVVNDDNFQEEVLDSELPVLVDFWAPWCGYCVKLGPIIEELASELQEQVKFVKLNVDENKGIAQEFEVLSLPTMILFKEGEPVERLTGFMPKQIIENKLDIHL